MNTSTKISLMLVLSIVIVLGSSADAIARRYSRRSSNSYGSGGIKDIAPKADPVAEGYRSLRVHYRYNRAMADDVAFTDRLRVFFVVHDERILNTSELVVAEAKLTDLSKESATCVRFCPVSFQTISGGEKLGVFDIENETGKDPVVEPAKVYRMFVNLHRHSATYSRETAFGHVPMPYYVATSDETRLGRARQHITMRTFKEFYYAQNGWASEEQYPMDCYAYYMWATGSCTVGAQNRRTILERLFGGQRPFQSGSEIGTLAQHEAIHGDYVRIPGHSFMLLAYAPKEGHVWTMEGNFNSTIEIVVRSVDSGWTVGHLVDEHVDPALFQVSRANPADLASNLDSE